MKVIPIQPDNQSGRNSTNGAQQSGEQTYLDPQMYMDPPPKSDKPIVVNGEQIELQDIALEAQNHPMPQHKPGWAWHAAAQALVWRTLFLQGIGSGFLISQGIGMIKQYFSGAERGSVFWLFGISVVLSVY